MSGPGTPSNQGAPNAGSGNSGGGSAYTQPLQTTKVARIGKSFSSRNPLPIGAIGLAFLLVLVFAAFNASSLPLIGGGTQYTAYFTGSANLKQDSDVRIAGVKVGKVQDVTISGDQVKVTFTVKDGWVGNQSTVDIKLKTLLGAKYLSINSTGSSAQDPGTAIPHQASDGTIRTTSPDEFDVYPAFTKLRDTVHAIDTKSLAKAFGVLSADFSGTPNSVRPLVNGLSRLSATISSRDGELNQLLTQANAVTGVLADRSADLQQLLSDGNLLLSELNARRDAIHSLLINTQVLSTQLRGLVADNQKTIGPLLDSVSKILKLLQANETSLDRGLSLLGPFYRVFNNVIGNGRWFDNYIQNLSASGVLGLVLGGVMAKLPKTVSRIVVLAVVLAVVAGGVYFLFFRASSMKKATAQFDAAVGVYSGTPVKILGVNVGDVTAVKPHGAYVNVTLEYDSKYKLAPDAQALEVANSLVSDRYIQLTPLYNAKRDHGKWLPADATIPNNRTGSPAELDDIYAALDKLSVALGPNGANKNGALATLLKVSAANLKGNGQAIGNSIHALALAAQTLSNNKGNLFATVQHLQTFSKALAASDGQVRRFNAQLAQVTSDLAAERTDLGAALHDLGLALDDVNTFIKKNAGKFHTTITKLEDITGELVKQKASLNETLSVAPVALANIVHAYQPNLGVIATRGNLVSLTDINGGTVCAILHTVIKGAGGVVSGILGSLTGTIDKTCKTLLLKMGGGGGDLTTIIKGILGGLLGTAPNSTNVNAIGRRLVSEMTATPSGSSQIGTLIAGLGGS